MMAYSSSYNPQRPVYSDAHSHSYLSVGSATNQIPALAPSHHYNPIPRSHPPPPSHLRPPPHPHPNSGPGPDPGRFLGPTTAPVPNPSPLRNSHTNPNLHPGSNPNQVRTVPIPNPAAAQAPAPFRHTQQQQQQQQPQQQQPQQQQFYPNAYSHPTPSPSSSFIQPRAIEGQAHHPLSHVSQHVPNQIHHQHYGNGGPTSMPPPSTLPNAAYARRAYENLHHQRPVERWPPGPNEGQHRLQEQYVQGQPTYDSKRQQQYQPQHSMTTNATHSMTTNVTAASISSVSPVKNHTHPTPTPPPSTKPQPSMTATVSTPGPPSQTSKPTLQPPVASPLESQRVNVLLDLNRVLLQEVVSLQNAGKAGIPTHSREPEVDPKAEGGSAAMTPTPKAQPGRIVASKEFIEYMRRLQSNLAYLAGIAERATKPQNVQQFPAIMEEPTSGETEDGKVKLKELYGRLRELWPDWKGKQVSAV